MDGCMYGTMGDGTVRDRCWGDGIMCGDRW